MTRITGEPCVVLAHPPLSRKQPAFDGLQPGSWHGSALVARGARGGRRGRTLQPFALLQAGWSGRGGLATLTAFETRKQYWFRGDALAAGFYVAELLMRLAGEREGHPATVRRAVLDARSVRAGSRGCVAKLRNDPARGTGLRCGLRVAKQDGGRPIEPDKRYRFDPQHGFSEFASERAIRELCCCPLREGEFSVSAGTASGKAPVQQSTGRSSGSDTAAQSTTAGRAASSRASPVVPPSCAGQ